MERWESRATAALARVSAWFVGALAIVSVSGVGCGKRSTQDREGTSAEETHRKAKHEGREACRGWPLLVGHDDTGAPRRAYVPATIDGRRVALWLDTGSASSFVRVDLDADVSVERGQTSVIIGDGAGRSLPGRRTYIDPDAFGAKERDDLTIAGVLGAEEVLAGTTDLDLRAACVTRYPRGFAVAEAVAWPSVPFDVVHGVIVTNVEIDDARWQALFDTGVADSILVTSAAGPFFDHQTVLDVRGHPVELYRADGTVRWGESPRERVRVTRTPRFDTFDDMKLGDVHAMVGINAMGVRRIVVDPERRVLLVEPRW